ncbi:hypothetical protein [Pedobacter sp. Leaf250]|uniref:hypothetical protein n=1 Tax=Pedobacter sp. Leaf250 TaxID=2876559 RepID=UPI001E483EC7|nr:hypothetical protein [Pedobacter sp. Leaf250]
MISKIPIEILAHKLIQKRNWYLCKGNLMDYLSNLKDGFYEFAIQRKIVKNQYLDSLYQTIKSGDPIPVLTLTYQQRSLNEQSEKNFLDMKDVEILDGLQRTFRLWAYKILAESYNGEDSRQIIPFAKALKSSNPLLFESGVISSSVIKNMITTGEILKVRETFSAFDIYFIVWAGLDEKEVVKKMLVLNAGQKAVSPTHQFELLFLHFFESIKKSNTSIELFREKDVMALEVKNGRRKTGQFMFSSFIVGLQSFVEQKPLRVTTESPIGIENEDEGFELLYDLIFNLDYLKKFVELLVGLDKVIYNKEREAGLEWFVKETTLSGVLAAVGKTIDFKSVNNALELFEQSESAFNKLENSVKSYGFNIDSYRIEFANISSRAINFGTFTRKTIMQYTLDLLSDGKPTWKELFMKTQGGV